jgi:hypothetical protein
MFQRHRTGAPGHPLGRRLDRSRVGTFVVGSTLWSLSYSGWIPEAGARGRWAALGRSLPSQRSTRDALAPASEAAPGGRRAETAARAGRAEPRAAAAAQGARAATPRACARPSDDEVVARPERAPEAPRPPAPPPGPGGVRPVRTMAAGGWSPEGPWPPAAALARRYLEALAGADSVTEAGRFLAEDARMRLSGRNPFSGEHLGSDAVLAIRADMEGRSGGTWRIRGGRLIHAGLREAELVVEEEATGPFGSWRGRRRLRFGLAADAERIVLIEAREDDQLAFDVFWSETPPGPSANGAEGSRRFRGRRWGARARRCSWPEGTRVW